MLDPDDDPPVLNVSLSRIVVYSRCRRRRQKKIGKKGLPIFGPKKNSLSRCG